MCDAPYSAHAVARPGPARRRECTGPAGASRTCPRPSPTTRTLHKFTSHHTHSPGHRRSARHTSRRRSMPAGEERRAGRRRVAWPHRHGPTALSLSLPGRKIVGPPPPGRAEYGAGRRTLRMARPRRSSACARCARRRSPPRISENRGLWPQGPGYAASPPSWPPWRRAAQEEEGLRPGTWSGRRHRPVECKARLYFVGLGNSGASKATYFLSAWLKRAF